MSIEVKIEFSKEFQELGDAIKKIIQEEIYRAALQTQNKARQIAPIDTGNLRRTIQATGWEDVEKDMIFHVQAKAEYAGYVEFGTVKMKARPYLMPSAEDSLQDFAERVTRRINGGG